MPKSQTPKNQQNKSSEAVGVGSNLNALLASKSAKRQIMFWTGALVFTIFALYLFRSILLPYVAGMALAYLLDPIADWLERRGMSRVLATSLILLVFVLTFVYVVMRVLPVLLLQLANFIEHIPSFVKQLQDLIANSDSDWLKKFVGDSTNQIKENFDGFLEKAVGWLTSVLASLWSSGVAIVDAVSLLVITPIVAFYLLLDWDRMVAKIQSWIPKQHKQEINEIGADINAAIAGFVRGQGTVCLMLGSFYAVSLTAAGLNFGLLIGLISGIISFIPFVGSIVGLVMAIGVAIVQFWPDYFMIFLVMAIFGFGQFVEGNFLQPKLVGESVGLHPVWIMFALSAFAVLLGFTGLLIAVPVAAGIGVLVRFGLEKYLKSDFYLGTGQIEE